MSLYIYRLSFSVCSTPICVDSQQQRWASCLLCTATSSAIHLAIRTRPMPPSAWQTFREFPRIQGEISIHISVNGQILVGKVGTWLFQESLMRTIGKIAKVNPRTWSRTYHWLLYLIIYIWFRRKLPKKWARPFFKSRTTTNLRAPTRLWPKLKHQKV